MYHADLWMFENNEKYIHFMREEIGAKKPENSTRIMNLGIDSHKEEV